MARSLEQIVADGGLTLSPEMLRSDGSSILPNGLVICVHADDAIDTGSSWLLAAVCVWFAGVFFAWSLRWLDQGNEGGVLAAALSIPLLIVSVFWLLRTVWQRIKSRDTQKTTGTTYWLSVGPQEYGPKFFESTDRAEVELVRNEIERVFAAK